jgi:hypothetical protein
VPQGLHRLDAGGTHRGQPAGGERDRNQQPSRANQRRRIRRLQAVEHRPHQLAQSQRDCQASQHPCNREPAGLAEHHASNLPPPGSECESDTNLVRALRHGVRHDSVDAH